MRNILAISLLLAALPAAAHDMSKLGPRGGQLAHVASNHFELLPLPGGGARLFLYGASDDNPPVDAGKASATARFVVGGKLSAAVFSPAGGNMLVAKGAALKGDWSALVRVTQPGKPIATVRFNTAVMAAQAKATDHANH